RRHPQMHQRRVAVSFLTGRAPLGRQAGSVVLRRPRRNRTGQRQRRDSTRRRPAPRLLQTLRGRGARGGRAHPGSTAPAAAGAATRAQTVGASPTINPCTRQRSGNPRAANTCAGGTPRRGVPHVLHGNARERGVLELRVARGHLLGILTYPIGAVTIYYGQ